MTYARVVVVATAILTGCVATAGCPDGMARPPGGDECVPLPDAAADAGDPADAGDAGDTGADAGPCGMACTGATPVCDTGSGMCVGCLGESDCAAPTALCDTAANLCVACLGDTACAADPAMPICDAGACRGCTGDADCAGMASSPVCDEPSGRCVECTADSEAAECAAFSCSRLTLTCTTTMRGFQDTCDACEADSECQAGRRCVMHTFMGTDAGYFCFLDSAMGGCGDTDMTRRPYRTRTELDSIDGVRATYCMPPVTTTCAGIRDTQSVACTMDTDCGVTGEDDGFCPSGGTGAGLCSYLCGGAVDCRPPLSCGGTPGHCRP